MPGRPEGETSSRIEEQELKEAGRRPVEDEAMMHAHRERRSGFLRRLFRRRPSDT